MGECCHVVNYGFTFGGRALTSCLVSYQVLARKYRPQTFDELVGQDHVVQTLKNAIETKRVAHAFLFVGPRGIGKTSTARILAKALNAPGGPRIDFDPEEETCREIAEGRSMDVIEIDGASNNNVDQIRELRDNVQYAPSRGNFKIYIIDEVHMLSSAAFNALLKTLEEPPAHVKFIFATTEPHKVLATILSRCQRFDLKRISDLDIAKQLKFIADQESIQVEETALKILARNAEGGMRDAESAFDQLISFCGDTIREEDVLEVFGLTGHQEIWNLAEAIQAGQADLALKQVRELIERGKDLGRLTQELLRYFRNLLLFIISAEIAREELDETELHHYEAMQPLPSRASVLAIIDELIVLEEKIRFALVKEVLFEIAVIRMTQQREKIALEEIIQSLATGQLPAPPVAKSAPTEAPAPVPEKKAEAAVPDPKPASPPAPPAEEPEARPAKQDADLLWKQVCERVRGKELVLRRALTESRVQSLSGDRLDVVLKTTKDAYQTMMNSRAVDLLEKECRRQFGDGVRLKCTLDEVPEKAPEPAPEPPAETASKEAPRAKTKPKEKPEPDPAGNEAQAGTATPAVAPDKSDFENDPLIRQALEEFEARIVEIKAKA
jgi:DNA polymerase-3 subunit gamma/tau